MDDQDDEQQDFDMEIQKASEEINALQNEMKSFLLMEKPTNEDRDGVHQTKKTID